MAPARRRASLIRDGPEVGAALARIRVTVPANEAPELLLAVAPGRVRLPQSVLALHPLDALLLAWLALEGPTPRGRLAELLWPDRDPAAARNSLRQRLFQLRRQAGVPLVTGTATLALAEGVRHDLLDADTVLGDEPPGPTGEMAHWLGRQRARRRERARAALAELAAMAEQARDWPDALAHAGELLALDPLSEDAHRRLMRLHYLAGDRAAALLAFDRCERVLKDEVGARPSAATLALLDTVEQSRPDDPWPTGPVAALLRPPRLVGRDAERAALADAVAEGAVLLLGGEAGVGKSRLLAELAELAAGEAPGAVLAVGARPGDADVPYAVAGRLLRALLAAGPGVARRADLAPALPEAGGPALSAAGAEAARRRLAAATEALLQAATTRGLRVVVVDDLHHVDAASLVLLQAVAGSGGCAWVLAMRPAELPPAAQALVAAQQASSRCRTLTLAPLKPEDVGVLLDSLAVAGLDARQALPLHRRTGGNPLYLLETLKLAVADRPAAPPVDGRWFWPRADGVLHLIQRRMARLSPLAVKLMRCAAVAGQDLSVPLATQVLALTPLDLADAWAELEAADVLRDQAFAHDLIAEAAMAGVPRPIARALHAEVARWLQAREGPPLRLAEHLLQAGEGPRAAHWLVAAGHEAMRAWRCDEAADAYERAARLLQDAGEPAAAFEAWLCCVSAVTEFGFGERVQTLSRTLDDLASDDGQRAAALLVQASLATEAGRFDEAGERVTSALALARAADRAEVEVELLWTAVVLAWERRRLDEAVGLARRALQRIGAVDLRRAPWIAGTRFKLHHALGVVQVAAGRYAQARVDLQTALELAAAEHDASERMSMLDALGHLALAEGDLALAIAHAKAADASQAEAPTLPADRLLARTLALALDGDLGGALAVARDMVARAERQGRRYEALLMARLHWLHVEIGRPDLARRGLGALARRDDLPPSGRALVQATRLHAGERFDPGPVLEHAAAIEDLGLRATVLCLAQPGCEPARILPLLTLTAAAAEACGAQGLWLMLQCRRTAALSEAGRHDEAAALAAAVWPRLAGGLVCAGELFPRAAATLHAALAAPQPALAAVIAGRTADWIARAAATLPTPWQRRLRQQAPLLLPAR